MGHFQGMRRPLVGLAGFFGQRQEPDEDTRHTRRLLEKIMHTLEELLDKVEGQGTKIDSLITLAKGLHDQVITAMGDTITPSQHDRIDRVFDAVTQSADKVDAAITANTIEATAGAVTGGPSAADIKQGIAAGGEGQPASSQPATPAVDGSNPA